LLTLIDNTPRVRVSIRATVIVKVRFELSIRVITRARVTLSVGTRVIVIYLRDQRACP
jgi:hypothetical protein